MANKTAANLLQSKTEYSRYYGGFRGVDFSSDHTQVHEQRFAYSVNMFKDYGTGQGQAIETIPGFRRRVALPGSPKIFGIHSFEQKAPDSMTAVKVLIHAGEHLYLWHNYPRSIGVSHSLKLLLPKETTTVGVSKIFEIELEKNISSVSSVTRPTGEDVAFVIEARTLRISSETLAEGDVIFAEYTEGELRKALFTEMNCCKSTSFVINNRLYLIDGKNYLVFDGDTVKSVLNSSPYVPTTYINIIPSGENADIGKEYEQRNMLSPLFKHTFIPDGLTKDFYLNVKDLDGIEEVKLFGLSKVEGKDYTVDLAQGKISFLDGKTPPAAGGVASNDASTDADKEAAKNYPSLYAGLEILARKTLSDDATGQDISSRITRCTVAAIFDNRIFLSGDPQYPNHVYHCARNSTGYTDPSYFGILNYMQDGVGSSPVAGMIPVADTLAVIKRDSRQEGVTYFHTARETGENLVPKLYPATQGLSGIGCLGACISFLDDPVFVSRLGLEAIGQLSVRLERAVEHRSSLIDAKLVNMNLENAVLEEWNGYLILLVDGKIFMADSRQRYTHESGVMQYEWYYLEDIGIFEGQYDEYRYATQEIPSDEPITILYCPSCKEAVSGTHSVHSAEVVRIPLTVARDVQGTDADPPLDLTGEAVNPPDESGKETGKIFSEVVQFTVDEVAYSYKVHYTVHEVCDHLTGEVLAYKAYLCEAKGNKTGGSFGPALVVKSLEDNLFFGTENGYVCSFNFDLREDTGEIAPRHYTFDERTIFCGCATKMDHCGIPHLTKNTVKKSTVIKSKSMRTSSAKIKIRTNKKPWEQIARINSSLFSFEDMDFADFSFITTDQTLFAVKEKEKKWVEKQYFLYSDEYRAPFALYYIAFRYHVAGRYKS